MRKVVSQRLRRCVFGGFALCLLIGGVVLSGQMSAFASAGATNRDAVYPTASISGTITDASGQPITTKDVCVEAYTVDQNGNGYGQVVTDASGHYAISYLPAGDYNVEAFDCRWSTRNDPTTYYSTGSNGSASTITLADAQSQTAIDIQLPAGTSVSGHVYGGSGTSTPLKGACVTVSKASSEYDEVGFATTAADGSYIAGHLPAGGYKVEFSPCSSGSQYSPEWYDGQSDFADANTITPTTANPSTGIDGHLTNGASISGTVTDAGGNAITSKDICVSAYTANFAGGTSGNATTDANGNYTIDGLLAGTYDVQFSDCYNSKRNDVTQFYGNAPDAQDSTPVVLSTSGAKSGVNAQLAAATTISGHAYAGSGTSNPLKSICVSAQAKSRTVNYYYYSSASTDTSGAYTIKHLAPITGGYTVEFIDCSGAASYVTQYYGGDYQYTNASVVVPTVASPATGIDAHLDLGGVITGTIDDSSSKPITSGVCVGATRTGGAYYYGYSSSLDSAGRYSIGGLPGGSYNLEFYDCGNRNDVPQALANSVSVTLGQTTSGVNVTMQAGTSITGTVYGGTGNSTPLASLCVEALTPSGQSLGLYNAGYAYTDSSGRYTLGHLPSSGKYVVDFNPAYCGSVDSGYGSQYYDGVSDLSQADVLTPTVASPSTGIDAHLPTGAPVTTITGGPANNAQTSQTDARFSFTANQSGATFQCALDGGAYRSCTSPYDTGTLSTGQHTLYVEATSNGQTELHPPHVTWTVNPSSTTSTSQGQVAAGGTFDSDPGGQTSAAMPVIVGVTPPSASQVTLTTEPVTTTSGNGYTIFGSQQIDIAAADPNGAGVVTGTTANPIKLDFTLDKSQIPAGTDVSTITVTRNGVPAANCAANDGTANPDPCVESRTPTAGGGVEIVLLTTHCSVWNFAVVQLPANTAAPAAPSGIAQQGQKLIASTGTWTHASSFSYQWEDCDSAGANCTPISGATQSTYTLQSADVGHTIRVIVSGANSAGSGTPVSSAPTGVVQAPPSVGGSGSGGTPTTTGSTPTTTGGTPTISPTPTSTPAPTGITPTASLQRATVSGTTANVTVSCSGGGGACQVTFALSALEKVKGGKVIAVVASKHPTKTKSKAIAVGALTATVTAGSTKTFTISLNGLGKQLLKQFKTLTVQLTVTEPAAGGHSVKVATQRLTFRQPANKHKK